MNSSGGLEDKPLKAMPQVVFQSCPSGLNSFVSWMTPTGSEKYSA
jgi:hypothetical protein